MISTCEYCGVEMESQRTTKRFCSPTCAQRKARGWPKTRICRHCGAVFQVRERADANRQHCSKECAKNHNAKNPGAWVEKSRADRLAILELLGGQCVVCGTDNPSWRHADYIPTTRSLRFRHPRHLAFMREHIEDFRVLCANHHYELTLTGRIEGTDITQ